MNKFTFGSQTLSRDDLFTLKGSDLVVLHNKLAAKAGVADTRRFSSIGAGVERTWKLLQKVGKPAEVAAPAPVAKKAPAAKSEKPAKVAKAPKAKKAPAERANRRRGTNIEPAGHAPLACREGSKQAALLDALNSANGATMDELLDALKYGNKPWTEATVRSGFGWDLKQKGYGVRSQFDEDGTERFFLVVPKGYKVPAHTPLKGKPKADARQTKMAV